MTKRFWLIILLLVYFAASYTIMNYFNISCVFLDLLGFPCPGCGMTRAFLSLLKLDFCQALKHNAVIFFMPYVFLYIIFGFKHKAHLFALSGIGIIAFVNWIIKLIYYF